MDQDLVLYQVEDGIATLTLNAPAKRNALSMALRKALLACLDQATSDPQVRVVLLAANGPVFCAGGDISQMSGNTDAGLEVTRQRMDLLHAIVRRIVAGPKPVIAVVDGAVAGAGLSLAAACDYIVATPASRFGAPFGKLGLMADMGLIWTLQCRTGHSFAKDMLLSGRMLDLDEALQRGLVDEAASPETLRERALAKAGQYLSSGPLALAATKTVMSQGVESLDQVLGQEAAVQLGLTLTADHSEGARAFMEKRAPRFQGR